MPVNPKRFVVCEFRGGMYEFTGTYDTVEEVMQNHPGSCLLIDLKTGLVGLPHGYTEWIAKQAEPVRNQI